MKREIKFRARFEDGSGWFYWEARSALYPDQYGIDANDLDLVSIGQFTGLRDAKAVEIYEGDIFIVGTEPWVVSWDEDDAGFWLTQPALQKGGRLNLGMMRGEAEVAGNVYENADLLPEVQTNLAI